MKTIRHGAALLACALATGSAGLAAEPSTGPARRFALVVGANHGAADRIPLRYAVADAERFAEVVSTMGGVLPADRIDLHDPDRKELLAGLERTGARAAAAKAASSRVEVIFYFSGHADDQGLMLGKETVPYRELRTAVSSMGADVGITILDACASGAITRLKGGKTHPAFLTGPGSEIQGYAFLTSSSENETAQESERLRGSFFTHALVSGLRGAADVTGDGRVTLNEAYQFAFHETLVQTAPTEGGTQHPSYDIRMAGTGEVVMTDVRQTSSSLVLGEELEGRFVVLSDKSRLVAELYKPAGRRVELGLDAGEYEVFFEQEKQRLTSKVALAEGTHQELRREQLKVAPRTATRSRGGSFSDAQRYSLDGRVRAQVSVASWSSRFTFLYGYRDWLALELGFGTPAFAGSTDLLLGARYYPPLDGRVRPYVGLAVGRVEVPEPTSFPNGTPDNYYFEHAVLGGEVKAGTDFNLSRHFSLNVDFRGTFASGGFWQGRGSLGLGFSFGGR
jgi:caspase domain-containing protein